jgi:hypothetical protein
MLRTIKRLHRVLVVDRLAETRLLRSRAGANATWAHSERHARAWRRASDRHATARARASARADEWHAKSRERARRLAAQHDWPERVLRRWLGAVRQALRSTGTQKGEDAR